MIPYRATHVPTYHLWMQDENLQVIQIEWGLKMKIKEKSGESETTNPILLIWALILRRIQVLTGSEPLSMEEEVAMQKSWHEDPGKCTFIVLSRERLQEEGATELTAMVGDTNLFLLEEATGTAEAEIMIADAACRGSGLGWEAMLLMLRYGSEKLGLTKYVAKIKEENHPSLKMFTKIGFTEQSRSHVFKEVTLEWRADLDWLQKEVPWQLETYSHM